MSHDKTLIDLENLIITKYMDLEKRLWGEMDNQAVALYEN
jgi:hypothetical protein